MFRIRIAVFAYVALAVSTACGQAALDRVEQLMRNQLGGAAAVPAPAAPQGEPGFLGLTADDRADQGRGVRISQVLADGPADRGGLLQGDLITAVDGRPIRVMHDMALAIHPTTAGQQVTFTVDRQGVIHQQQVTLGQRPVGRPIGPAPEELPGPSSSQPGSAPVPNLPGESAAPPKLGVRTLPYPPEAARDARLSRGAQVVSVASASPAALAGIPVGAVITAVDERPVLMPHELAEVIAQSAGRETVEITYSDRGVQSKAVVRLAAGPPILELRGRPVTPDPPAPQSEQAPVLPVARGADDAVSRLEARIRELESRLQALEAKMGGQ